MPVENSQGAEAKQAPCRFFNTKQGCRAGGACPYVHTPSSLASKDSSSLSTGASVATNHVSKSQRPAPRPAAAPKPQVEDVRTFQVGQIHRRFKPKTDEKDHATVFTFQMIPTDPDFPYEINALDCSLEIPLGYPDNGRPLLRILNRDIPRGFQINIENGFDALYDNAPGATLLGLMNRLDKQLESILSGEMAQTVKLVVNRGPPKPTAVPVPTASVTIPPPRLPVLQEFTPEQKADAEKKRQSDKRQLEARFGRLQHFAKSPDGFSYTLPIDSPKRQSWPASLRSLRSFTLLLPALYPLEASTIMLDEESKEARNVETAFEARSKNHLDATLTQQINYLTQHLHEMAMDREQEPDIRPAPVSTPQKTFTPAQTGVTRSRDPDRPHLQVIERPPEWTMVGGEDDESDLSSSDGYSYDSGDDIEDSHDSEDGGAPVSAPVEKGVLISFPQLELYGIELMELTTLNISVKCERCKDIMDVERLHNSISSDGTGVRDASCKKCATRFSVGFRADLMHANSVRAGYLDLDGCTVVDMLPSSFMPTCAECSTPHPAPGVVSVRGESTMAICRECHKKTSFRIPEVKFLQISAAAIRASKAPVRKKTRETLGIVAGTELPRRGRCEHYSKSYRWFRFSCCNKVFACDRCHDAATDHPNEHANRMICGHCSREQAYRPSDCSICHSSLVSKKGTGFWEGGKGTRDKSRMSRKDPRKYKRRGGSKVGGGGK